MTKPRLTIPSLSVLLAASLLAGCFVWSDADDPSLGNLGVSPGGLPERPPQETSLPDDPWTLCFAAYHFELTQPRDRWRSVGLNLDRVESYEPDDPRPCKARSSRLAEDGEDGIDNQYGALLAPTLSLALPTAVCELSASHMNGIGTFVACIEKWNGTANDAQISAWLVPAVNALSTADGREPAGLSWGGERGLELLVDGEPAPPPCYDGNDLFYLNQDELFVRPQGTDGSRLPRLYDLNAYIVDNVIVAKSPPGINVSAHGLYRSLPVRFAEAYIVARLSDDYQRVEEGTLAGRLPTNEIDATAAVGVCDSGLTSAFRGVIANAADMMSNPEADFSDQTCDAISAGIAFKGARVQVAEAFGPAWAPDFRCDFESQWAMDEVSPPVLYGCVDASSTYSWQEAWDRGEMAHCTKGTYVPGITTTP